MKHHDSLRPIGKCKGCSLNRRRTCAAALEPKTQWDRGRCSGFGKEELLLEESRFAIRGAKFSRLLRRAKAMQLASLPRQNGKVHAARKGRTGR